MATEDDDMVLSRRRYGSTDISGNYSEFATAMGGYGERVTEPDQILHALVRGIRMTREGTPVLLEFITAREKTFSTAKSR
jgi:acetolactate synthase-1/2/3 large subunit